MGPLANGSRWEAQPVRERKDEEHWEEKEEERKEEEERDERSEMGGISAVVPLRLGKER